MLYSLYLHLQSIQTKCHLALVQTVSSFQVLTKPCHKLTEVLFLFWSLLHMLENYFKKQKQSLFNIYCTLFTTLFQTPYLEPHSGENLEVVPISQLAFSRSFLIFRGKLKGFDVVLLVNYCFWLAFKIMQFLEIFKCVW